VVVVGAVIVIGSGSLFSPSKSGNNSGCANGGNPVEGIFHNDPASGSISSGNKNYVDGQTDSFACGQNVDISANPPSGYDFQYWNVSGRATLASTSAQSTSLKTSLDCAQSASCNFTLTAKYVLSTQGVNPKNWSMDYELSATPADWLHTGKPTGSILVSLKGQIQVPSNQSENGRGLLKGTLSWQLPAMKGYYADGTLHEECKPLSINEPLSVNVSVTPPMSQDYHYLFFFVLDNYAKQYPNCTIYSNGQSYPDASGPIPVTYPGGSIWNPNIPGTNAYFYGVYYFNTSIPVKAGTYSIVKPGPNYNVILPQTAMQVNITLSEINH